VTAVFYRAVHLVEAHFASHDIHSPNHFLRTREVGRLLPNVVAEYATKLLRLSRVARYESEEQLTAADYEEARAAFMRVEAAVRANGT